MLSTVEEWGSSLTHFVCLVNRRKEEGGIWRSVNGQFWPVCPLIQKNRKVLQLQLGSLVGNWTLCGLRMHLLTAFSNKMWQFRNLGQVQSSFSSLFQGSVSPSEQVCCVFCHCCILHYNGGKKKSDFTFCLCSVHGNGQTSKYLFHDVFSQLNWVI